MKKNFLTMLFTICLLFILSPTTVQAEISGECGTGVTWSFNESGGVLTISGKDEGSMYSYSEEDIAPPWESYRDSIKSIEIDSGVKGMGVGVFQNLTNLIDVKISDGVKNIAAFAFSGCSNLQSIEIPDSVKVIDSEAFEKCTRLESVTFPKDEVTIQHAAFRDCTSLRSVTLSENVIFGEYGHAFSGCTKLENVIIPNTSVIKEGTFSDCSSLKSVTLPEALIGIGEAAFSRCSNLVDLDIPNSVTEIGRTAFHLCTSLENIVVPEGVESIADDVFNGCQNLRNITLPKSVTSIGACAFEGCNNLEDIVIPNAVTSIGWRAFHGCYSISSITIPEGVTDIGWGAFENCTKLANIVIPDSITSIGNRAFYSCIITEVVIPDGVTSIEENTFAFCNNLRKVTLPASITKIGKSAFVNCNSICDVYYSGTEEQRTLISIETGNDYLTKIAWRHLHSEEIDLAIEPTYFETGLTEGSHCSVCGETITEQQTVPKKTLGVPVVTATAGTDSVKLAWKQIDGASGYEIFRSDQQPGSYSKIQTVSEGNMVSFNDTGLNADTTYYYKVRAVVTVNGNSAYSSDSAIASAKTESETQKPGTSTPANPEPEQPKPETPAPEQPKQETPLPENPEAGKPAAITYTIEVSAGKGGKVSGGATKKADEKVTVKATPDKGYYFIGWKEGSKKVSSSQTYTFKAEKNRKLTAGFAKLSKPALTVSSSDTTSIKVNWKKITGATGYEVYRAASKNGKYTKKATISSAKTVSYTDKKLTTGKAYYYKVRAVAAGTVKTTYSDYSSVKNAKPVPSKVTNVKASAGSKSVKLSWKKAAGTTGYEIYRAESKNGKYKKVKTISKAATASYTDKKLKAKKKYYYKVRAYKTVSGKKVYGDYSSVKNTTTKK